MSDLQSQSSAFTFSEVAPRYTESREISMNRQPATLTGINSFSAQCGACGEHWRTNQVQHVLGGVYVSCPNCRTSEVLRLSALLGDQAR